MKMHLSKSTSFLFVNSVCKNASNAFQYAIKWTCHLDTCLHRSSSNSHFPFGHLVISVDPLQHIGFTNPFSKAYWNSKVQHHICGQIKQQWKLIRSCTKGTIDSTLFFHKCGLLYYVIMITHPIQITFHLCICCIVATH